MKMNTFSSLVMSRRNSNLLKTANIPDDYLD